MELKDILINNFSAQEASDFQKENFEEFKKLGFPTIKNEEWKYTSLSEATKQNYKIATIDKAESVSTLEIDGLDAYKLYFVNGLFDENISSKNIKGLVISLNYQPDTEIFGQYKRYNKDGLISLNNSYSRNGILIEIAKNTILDKPIVLYYINNTKSENSLALPHVSILANENTQAKFVEIFSKQGENTAFTNAITEVVLQENAHIEYYKFANEGENSFHVGTTQVNQLGKSVFHGVTVGLKGDVVRNNMNILMAKPYSESHIFGLTFLNNDSHIDNHTVVDHAEHNCESNELYKSVLDGNSTSVFNGKIFVRQDAQKTNAYQSSKNILLSNTASAYSKPQLEIWADDVKCSHGHATGQLNNDQIFYLRARGIGEQEAKKMLTKAFAKDILEKITIEPLKIYLEKLVEN